MRENKEEEEVVVAEKNVDQDSKKRRKKKKRDKSKNSKKRLEKKKKKKKDDEVAEKEENLHIQGEEAEADVTEILRAPSPPYTPRWFNESDVRKKLLFTSGRKSMIWEDENDEDDEMSAFLSSGSRSGSSRRSVRDRGSSSILLQQFRQFRRDMAHVFSYFKASSTGEKKGRRSRRRRLFKYARNGAFLCALLLGALFCGYAYYLTRNRGWMKTRNSLSGAENRGDDGPALLATVPLVAEIGRRNRHTKSGRIEDGDSRTPILSRANLRFRYESTTAQGRTPLPAFSSSIDPSGLSGEEIVSTLMELHVWPHGDDDVVFVESGCGTSLAQVLLRKMIELRTQRTLVATTASFAIAEGLTKEFAGLHPSVRIVEADPASLPVRNENYNKGFVVLCGDRSVRNEIAGILAEIGRVMRRESPVAMVVVSRYSAFSGDGVYDGTRTGTEDDDGGKTKQERLSDTDVDSFLSDVKRNGLVVVDDIRTDTEPFATVIVAVSTRE